MLADAEERITINRRARELIVSFGGDTNQAGQWRRFPAADRRSPDSPLGSMTLWVAMESATP